jgi:hypothetical protein
MLFTYQAEPVHQCRHRVIEARDRPRKVVVWWEKASTESGNVMVLLRQDLSGGQACLSDLCYWVVTICSMGLEMAVQADLSVEMLTVCHSIICTRMLLVNDAN